MNSRNANGKSRRTRVSWTPELDAKLGTMPDTQLAKALQVTSQCVGKRRRALGIPQYINPESADRTKLISDDVLQLLGTMSDSKLAKQLGLEPGHVRYRRVQAEIPVFQANSKVSEEMRSVLGTMSDEAIAERFCTYPKVVRQARELYSIPAYSRPEKVYWTPELLARLGLLPDTLIAGEIGVSSSTVANKRRDLGISPCPRALLTSEAMELLGKISDPEMAKRFGGASIRYFRLRKRLGINPFGRS